MKQGGDDERLFFTSLNLFSTLVLCLLRQIAGAAGGEMELLLSFLLPYSIASATVVAGSAKFEASKAEKQHPGLHISS